MSISLSRITNRLLITAAIACMCAVFQLTGPSVFANESKGACCSEGSDCEGLTLCCQISPTVGCEDGKPYSCLNACPKTPK